MTGKISAVKQLLKHDWLYATSVINHLYIMKEMGHLFQKFILINGHFNLLCEWR
jgi:hypothetical protein